MSKGHKTNLETDLKRNEEEDNKKINDLSPFEISHIEHSIVQNLANIVQKA